MKKNKFHSKGLVALPVPEGMLKTMKSGKSNATEERQAPLQKISLKKYFEHKEKERKDG